MGETVPIEIIVENLMGELIETIIKVGKSEKYSVTGSENFRITLQEAEKRY